MPKPSRDSGFTLAELLVATIILALVMTAAYSAMTTTTRMWRIGEADLRTWQDARTAMSLMTRELHNIMPAAADLVEGDDNSITFFAVTPPLDVDERSEARPLWITYRLKQDSSEKGRVLLREERLLESPLPASLEEGEELDDVDIDLGRAQRFEIAEGVLKLEITYYWHPPRETPDATEADEVPDPVELIVRDEIRPGDGIPQGMRLYLKLSNPNSEEGFTEFETLLAFNGETTQLDEDSLQTEELAL